MVMETQQAEPQFKSMFARDLEMSDLARSERLPFRRVGSETNYRAVTVFGRLRAGQVLNMGGKLPVTKKYGNIPF